MIKASLGNAQVLGHPSSLGKRSFNQEFIQLPLPAACASINVPIYSLIIRASGRDMERSRMASNAKAFLLAAALAASCSSVHGRPMIASTFQMTYHTRSDDGRGVNAPDCGVLGHVPI